MIANAFSPDRFVENDEPKPLHYGFEGIVIGMSVVLHQKCIDILEISSTGTGASSDEPSFGL